jgi:Predicted glutamine amidotransferases
MSNKKIVIGLSGGNSDVEGFIRSGINEMYIKAVMMAGAIPLIIPINQDCETIRAQLSVIDGLILTGGVDIHPKYYNQEILKECGEFDALRDEFEMLLLEVAVKQARIPIFGICRGLQILNVYFGGSLYQDINYNDFVKIKHTQIGSRGYGSHFIDIYKDTFLESIYGKQGFVNSYHHQSVNQLASNFKVVAKSKDGIIEAIEHGTKPIYAVQFHPEIMVENDEFSLDIFKYFINEVKMKK